MGILVSVPENQSDANEYVLKDQILQEGPEVLQAGAYERLKPWIEAMDTDEREGVLHEIEEYGMFMRIRVFLVLFELSAGRRQMADVAYKEKAKKEYDYLSEEVSEEVLKAYLDTASNNEIRLFQRIIKEMPYGALKSRCYLALFHKTSDKNYKKLSHSSTMLAEIMKLGLLEPEEAYMEKRGQGAEIFFTAD